MVHDIINGNVGGFSEAAQFGYYDLIFNVVWKNGSNFYFTANNAALNPGGSYTNDIELWVSDGTSAGTMMVKDINPGNTSGSYPIDFKEINGTLFLLHLLLMRVVNFGDPMVQMEVLIWLKISYRVLLVVFLLLHNLFMIRIILM